MKNKIITFMAVLVMMMNLTAAGYAAGNMVRSEKSPYQGIFMGNGMFISIPLYTSNEDDEAIGVAYQVERPSHGQYDEVIAPTIKTLGEIYSDGNLTYYISDGNMKLNLCYKEGAVSLYSISGGEEYQGEYIQVSNAGANMKKGSVWLNIPDETALSEDNSGTYSDVNSGDSYYEAVENLSGLGIISGYEDGSFQPERHVSRAEFAALVIRALNENAQAEQKKSASKFNDVPQSHWACGYINQGVAEGIISGYSDTQFGPEDNVTYAQGVKMLVCALGYDFFAQYEGGWPSGYMKYGDSMGITNGVSAATDDLLDRAQVAVMINNAMNVPLCVVTDRETTAWGNQEAVYEIKDGENGEYQTLLTRIQNGYTDEINPHNAQADAVEVSDFSEPEAADEGITPIETINAVEILNYEHKWIDNKVNELYEGNPDEEPYGGLSNSVPYDINNDGTADSVGAFSLIYPNNPAKQTNGAIVINLEINGETQMIEAGSDVGAIMTAYVMDIDTTDNAKEFIIVTNYNNIYARRYENGSISDISFVKGGYRDYNKALSSGVTNMVCDGNGQFTINTTSGKTITYTLTSDGKLKK